MRLEVSVAVPDGPWEAALEPGEAAVVDHPHGEVVVATICGVGARGGRVVLDGRALGRRSPSARVRAGLGMVVDTPVAADVAVRDHLAARVGRHQAEMLLEASELLAGRGDDPAGVLSGGERRVLAWLRAIAARPRAVVLDGAGAGLDRTALAWAGRQIAAWREDGVAVVLRPVRDEERDWL
jgi:branched-chain amino acid transport system ATP-binding protein